MKFLRTEKSTIIWYSITCLVLVGLSCIGLIYGCWEVVVCIALSSLFSLGHLCVCLFYKAKPDESQKNSFAVLSLTLFRLFFIILAIIVPALIIYFVPNSASAIVALEKKRYLFILFTGIPVFTSLIYFYLWSTKQ
ncbi:MAG: hypothetical protein H6689_03460 [Erysipelotrichaceae bacterium]|jgi:hypothetical protein|nr:hypothetical protein [Erysipelotrichaceae bacterium]